VARIFVAKGRPSNNPLIVHVPNVAAAHRVVAEWPERAALLAARFWPGPLTLVLPRHPDVPTLVTAGGPTVGVRVPAHPVALALLRAAGVPIAAPSANRSNRISPTRAEHVLADLNGRIDLILDAGSTSGGLESTVLDLVGETPTLLRPGLIAPGEIEAVIGPIRRQRPTSPVLPNAPLPSPGMLALHYAPHTPLEWGDVERVRELLEGGERVGWLTSNTQGAETLPRELQSLLTLVILPTDPQDYAARLYAELHALDRAGVARIVVDRLPKGEEWLAIRDRLQRATAQPE
jgi:L-threonylcarbamoyladenylate synthase